MMIPDYLLSCLLHVYQAVIFLGLLASLCYLAAYT